MKISKKRLIQIIKEEVHRTNEEQLSAESLENNVKEILSKLTPEEQAVLRQYIALVGDK